MSIEQHEAHPSEERIRKQFLDIARELSNLFPQHDLRFNLQSGTKKLRYVAADLSPEAHELTLGLEDTRRLVHEAIFTLKQASGHFDA